MIKSKITLNEIKCLTPIQFSIFKKLKENGPMTRNELCQAFGFKKQTKKYTTRYPLKYKTYYRQIEEYEKRTTIYDNLLKLQKRKVVKEFSKNNGKRGRPVVFWKIKMM